MAHGEAVAVEPLAMESPLPSGQDPMEIRWGINPTQKNKPIERNRAKGDFVPYGKWFPIQHHDYTEEFHSVDEEAPRGINKTRTAQEAQQYFVESLGQWGFQAGFYGVKDSGLMAVISRTLLPSLPDIRRICAENNLDCPIPTVCEGQDDLDFGERETCPTCWFTWLKSPACASYMQIVAQDGMFVHTAGDVDSERNVTPSMADLEKAQTATVTALQTGINALEIQWREVLDAFDKGERHGLDQGGVLQAVRKDIHKTAPQNRQMEMVRQFATASAGNAGNNDAATTERIVNVLDRIDQRLTRLETPELPVPAGASPLNGIDANVAYVAGESVLVDSEHQATVQEVKAAGWFTVEFPDGSTTNVRKDRLQKGV